MRLIRLCLISRRSMIASITQSASAITSKSSSRLPVCTRCTKSFSKKLAGRDWMAACKPASTIRLRTAGCSSVKPLFSSRGVSRCGTISSKVTCTPAFARCAAKADPIVPAPITTVLWIFKFIKYPPMLFCSLPSK